MMEPDDLILDEEPTEEASIPPEQFIAAVTQSPNLAAELSEGELGEIARQVLEDYALDYDSMDEWRGMMERGVKLAKLVKDEKTYPFKRAANVKYPLVTSAALQFNARAYPAIVPSDNVVKAKVWGKDPQGLKAARGERVANFLSYQLVNIIDEWEEDTDKLLVQLPIVGTMTRKWWYDPVAKRPRSRLLESGAFVVNDKVRTMSDAPRCGDELPLYPAEIKTRITSGQFVPFEYESPAEDDSAPQDFIEQHCRLDLDEDGYAEPYIVTVHKDKETVVRIVADFEPDDVVYTRETRDMPVPVQTVDMMGQPVMVEVMQPQEVVTGITSIPRGSYFVSYKFMPGLDGGFHGTGLGLLLGDISDTINSIINMLLDAGHMASLGGGFLGSEFRIKGGNQRFEPGEWKLTPNTGQTLRDSIVPMTFPGPDATLFSMLGMLIEAGKEISSTKDIMTGDTGGKTQTATTTLALIEQGMMVFTAAYKRIFRSLKEEFRLLAKINAATLDPQVYSEFCDVRDEQGQLVMLDPAQEFGAADMDIVPVADPRSVTRMQEMGKAQLLQQLAGEGMVDPRAAAKRVLEAASIGEIDELTPKPDPKQAEMADFQAKMMMQMGMADLTMKKVEIELTLAKIEGEKADTVKTMTEARLAELNAITGALKERRDGIEQTIRAGLGGLGQQPGNAGRPQGNGGYAGQATQGSIGPVLGRQPMAGGGQVIAAPFGGVAR